MEVSRRARLPKSTEDTPWRKWNAIESMTTKRTVGETPQRGDGCIIRAAVERKIRHLARPTFWIFLEQRGEVGNGCELFRVIVDTHHVDASQECFGVVGKFRCCFYLSWTTGVPTDRPQVSCNLGLSARAARCEDGGNKPSTVRMQMIVVAPQFTDPDI